MSAIEAKAKVKERHKVAVAQFRKWKKEHPNATRSEQVEMFDFLVDTGRMEPLSNAA